MDASAGVLGFLGVARLPNGGVHELLIEVLAALHGIQIKISQVGNELPELIGMMGWDMLGYVGWMG